MGGVRAGEDRERPVRRPARRARGRDRASGRSRCTPAASSPRCSATCSREEQVATGLDRLERATRWSTSRPPSRARRPRSGPRPARSWTGSAASTSRTATSPASRPTTSPGVRPYAIDPEQAAWLWDLSADLTGVNAFLTPALPPAAPRSQENADSDIRSRPERRSSAFPREGWSGRVDGLRDGPS